MGESKLSTATAVRECGSTTFLQSSHPHHGGGRGRSHDHVSSTVVSPNPEIVLPDYEGELWEEFTLI